MSVYNDLAKYLNDNNIKFEEEEIDKNVYQVAFKMEKQVNVFVYEYSHIKIFIPLGVNINDNETGKALSRVNEINVETYGYEIVLLEKDYYFIKTIPLMFDVKADDLINIIKQAEKKAEEVVGKIS